ncbi:MAG TPA: hypothetical protein VFV38_22095 [Ktedonobacteraceae bacterium]|nr:hypothetical protein [Ktedonobacteraceae bacterium]
MQDIAMLIRCPDRCCELLSDDLVTAECVVENLISQVLSTFFQVVLIEDISLIVPAISSEHEALLTLSLHALGCDPLPPVDHNRLNYALEERLSCALVELFGPLKVEHFSVC